MDLPVPFAKQFCDAAYVVRGNFVSILNAYMRTVLSRQWFGSFSFSVIQKNLAGNLFF